VRRQRRIRALYITIWIISKSRQVEVEINPKKKKNEKKRCRGLVDAKEANQAIRRTSNEGRWVLVSIGKYPQ
jgi:hypothetical protein